MILQTSAEDRTSSWKGEERCDEVPSPVSVMIGSSEEGIDGGTSGAGVAVL